MNQSKDMSIIAKEITFKYSGPLDCCAQIIKAEGVQGMYRGLFTVIIQEVPAYAAIFSCYEFIKNQFAKYQGIDRTQLGIFPQFVGGCFAGWIGWTVSYPQDFIKTRLQLYPGRYKKTFIDGGFIDCFKQIKQEMGWKGIWKGYLPCSIRAFWANGCGFVAYEVAKSFLYKY